VIEVIDRALAEDVGAGDVTSQAVVPADARARGRIEQKQPGAIAGLRVAEAVFRRVDPALRWHARAGEGEWREGGLVAEVAGNARSVLTGERVALNFLARLSGIATLTAQFVRAVEGTGVMILDTRKTTPGLRALEKQAVVAGGGYNHRAGLDDAFLIKENHIRAAGGVAAALRAAEHRAAPAQRVEIEVTSLAELDEALEAGAELILLDNFDLDGLRAAFDAVLTSPAGRSALQYAPTEGNPRLRALVAGRMTARGLPTTAADLLVTTGSQQALTLVATALLDPGDVVAVEEPTYLAALQCFQLAGARVVPVASDEHGIDPEALAGVLERERPRLLYLVPTFANPTGRTLPAERRAAVAALTARSGTWVVEDDPYGELRYRGTPVPPLAAWPAGEDRVLHLGSFSKIAAPGLRLGWLRAPEALRPALTVAKQAADLHTSTVDQAAAAAYLAATDLDAHVRTLCAAYRERRDAMVGALPGVLPPGSTWSDPDGGMFTWVRLPGDVDTADLLRTALRHDVAFVPGASFFAGTPDRATLRMSFTTHTPARIAEGMTRLAGALRA
jgi:nicotinate-nucleotide pyrophosphorylase